MSDQIEMVSVPRGFQCIDPERRKEIASMGGRAAHACGRAHQFSREEARAAGQKGGLSRRTISSVYPFRSELAALRVGESMSAPLSLTRRQLGNYVYGVMRPEAGRSYSMRKVSGILTITRID